MLDNDISDEIDQDLSETYDNYSLRVISFSLHRLGMSTKKLQLVKNRDQNIESLLEYNGVINRKIDFSKYKSNSKEKNIVIGKLVNENTPIAIYRHRNNDYIYNAKTNKSNRFRDNHNINNEAYEIYPSFQFEIKNIIDVMRFAFSIEKISYITLILVSIIVSSIALTVPIFTNFLVGIILPESNVRLLYEFIVILSIIGLSSAIGSYLQSLMVLRIETLADIRLQIAIWDKLFKLPVSFLLKYRTGDLSMRVDAITQLRQLLSNSVLTTIISTIFSFTFLILMFYYEPNFAVWGLAFSVANCIIYLFLINKVIKYRQPLFDADASLQNILITSLAGFSQIKSTQSESFILSQIMMQVVKNAKLTVKVDLYNNSIYIYGLLLSPLSAILSFGLLVTLAQINTGIIYDNKLLVNFISFYAAFTAFNGSLTAFASTIGGSIGYANVLWNKATPIIFAKPEEGYDNRRNNHTVIGCLRTEALSYSVDKSSNPILNGITIQIPEYKHTAIIGPSGCGKTTLIKLLLGFIEPTSGNIYIDNISLDSISLRNYRRQLGVVMQSSSIQSGTIREIVLSGRNFMDSRIWEILNEVALYEDVKQMPNGLDTLITDSGSNISGGQAQRFCIARALISNPKIIIMDEATSALDNNSQTIVQNTLESLGITRISIAHRLSTIQDADQIIEIQKGTIKSVKYQN